MFSVRVTKNISLGETMSLEWKRNVCRLHISSKPRELVSIVLFVMLPHHHPAGLYHMSHVFLVSCSCDVFALCKYPNTERFSLPAI